MECYLPSFESWHNIYGTSLDICIADNANPNNVTQTLDYLISFQLEYKTGKAGPTYWFTPDEVKMFYLSRSSLGLCSGLTDKKTTSARENE